MTLLITNQNQIIICAENEIISLNTRTKTTQNIQLPNLEIPTNLSQNQQDALKAEKSTIIAACFSKCNNYIAVCTPKQLVVYNNEFEMLKNTIVARTVSKIRFTPSNDVVVADKTGDVYLFKLASDKSEQLLGHLSMLLDVLVSDCGKYIVTCDRDEKIRVSQFPGSYNIVSFCLGHEEFVLNLEFYNADVLISTSGDGTIRFWDYLNGEQINIINTNDFMIDKSLVEQFSLFMSWENIQTLPITNMKISKINNRTILIVSLFSFDGLQIYEIVTEKSVNLSQIIKFDNKLLTFDLSSKLYVLTDTGILVYEFTNNKFVVSGNSELSSLYDRCQGLGKSAENISVLYKRKFDNVQEYHDKKKLRIKQQKK